METSIVQKPPWRSSIKLQVGGMSPERVFYVPNYLYLLVWKFQYLSFKLKQWHYAIEIINTLDFENATYTLLFISRECLSQRVCDCLWNRFEKPTVGHVLVLIMFPEGTWSHYHLVSICVCVSWCTLFYGLFYKDNTISCNH